VLLLLLEEPPWELLELLPCDDDDELPPLEPAATPCDALLARANGLPREL